MTPQQRKQRIERLKKERDILRRQLHLHIIEECKLIHRIPEELLTPEENKN